jgi:hypothetical protein
VSGCEERECADVRAFKFFLSQQDDKMTCF